MNDQAPREPSQELLRQWYSRAKGAQWHYGRASERLRRRHYWLGVPVVVLTAVVGTSVFATIGQRVDVWAQIAVGLVSVLAAVLAALQTFFRSEEKAEQYRRVAAGFASLRREIELTQVRIAGEQSVDARVLENVRDRLEKLLDSAPEVMFSGAPNETEYKYLEYLSAEKATDGSDQAQTNEDRADAA